MSGLSVSSDPLILIGVTASIALAFGVLSFVGWLLQRRVRRRMEKESGYLKSNRQMLALDTFTRQNAERLARGGAIGPWIDQGKKGLLPEEGILSRNTYELLARHSERKISQLRRTLQLLGILNLITTIGAIVVIAAAAIAYALNHAQTAFQLNIAGLILVGVKALLIGAIQAIGGIIVHRIYEARRKKSASGTTA